MAGRPSLRIGTHGKITRINRGGGLWLPRCRYRDADGVTRIMQRVGPSDECDHYGNALIEALMQRRYSTGPDAIGLETPKRLGKLDLTAGNDVLVAQAGAWGAVPQVVHRLDQIAHAGCLRTGKVLQIVDTKPVAPNPGQGGRTLTVALVQRLLAEPPTVSN